MLPRERFIEVDYEALIADREAVTRQLIAFGPDPPSPAPVIASLSPACGRPALDETGEKACGGAMMVLPSDRGRRSLEPESPVASWTRGASKTPTGAKGGNAPERAC